MTQVKFLALKNLGRLLAETADERETTDAAEPVSVGTPDRVESPGVEEDYALALRCYAAAVEIDGSDVGLWRRLGALAARRGLPHVARHALEMGVAVHPRHPLVLEDLAETLLAVGDFSACRRVATVLTSIDPRHARAEQMKRRAETLEIADGFDWNAEKGPETPRRRVDDDVGNAARGRKRRKVDADDEVTLRLTRRSWEAVASALATAMATRRREDDETDEGTDEGTARSSPGAETATARSSPGAETAAARSSPAARDEPARDTIAPARDTSVESPEDAYALLGRRVKFLVPAADGGFAVPRSGRTRRPRGGNATRPGPGAAAMDAGTSAGERDAPGRRVDGRGARRIARKRETGAESAGTRGS